jgi:hypothetical protein
MIEQQCTNYCLQKFADKQYEAMANIYQKNYDFFWGLVAFFIIYKLLEASIKASNKGFWEIGMWKFKKQIAFKMSEDMVKNVLWIKEMLFSIMFCLALVYAIVYGDIARVYG